jgi:hypothetical protein
VAPPAAPADEPPPVTLGADDSLLAALVAQCAGRPSLAAPLRSAVVRIEGHTLVLEVPPDFVPLATLHSDEYRDLARKATGQVLSLRIGTGGAVGGGEEAGPPGEGEAKKQKLREEAAREPAVQEAIDLFDGRLVDVREAKSSREEP